MLEADAVLTETLVLSAGTTLDCKGHDGVNHQLSPLVQGQNFSWGWTRYGLPNKPSVPSVPTTAVLIAGDASGVTVQNCVIKDFDFGVVIANNKLPNAAKPETHNRIVGNTLVNRYRGVEIIASDGNEVVGNTIHSFAGGSGGVSIAHDSDDNLVKGNTYVGPSDEEIPGPLFPGGKDVGRWGWGGEGVRVLGPVFSYHFRVGDRLFMGTHVPDAKGYRETIEEPPDAWAERNTIEGNDIEIPNRTANALVAESRSDRTTFRGNIVRLASDGISCVGHGVESRNVLAEGNTIYGVESGVLAANTINLVFRNNTVTNATFAGILLFFPRNATITNNVVTDSASGLHLFGLDGDWESVAHISKNDIFGNYLQVEAYLDAPLELSVNGEGNYWGHDSCPGFLPSDTNAPDLITDSHPFLAPVADAESPPDQC